VKARLLPKVYQPEIQAGEMDRTNAETQSLKCRKPFEGRKASNVRWFKHCSDDNREIIIPIAIFLMRPAANRSDDASRQYAEMNANTLIVPP
jgi:hypothetical protein